MKSNRLAFFIYKYFFLYLFILMTLGMIKEIIITGSKWPRFDFAICVYLILHLLISRYIYSAIVSNDGIQLSNKNIPWTEIKTLNRVYNLYYFRTKSSKRFFLFPSEILQNGFNGRISETGMDQKIERMKVKYEIS